MPLRATSNIIGFDMMLQRNDVAFFINAHLVRFGGGFSAGLGRIAS